MFQTLFHKKTYRTITHQEAKQRLASGNPVVLLDVRNRDEYESVHIPGAKLLPLSDLERKIAAAVPDKDAEIIVYCLSGSRASSACTVLSSLGYTNVSSMGGIRGWTYETEEGRERK